MKRTEMFRKHWVACAIVAGGVGFGVGVFAQSVAAPKTYVSSDGDRLKILLDRDSLGSADVEVGELTFTANTNSGQHVHGALEIFYVVSGELEHVVNGKSQILKPGMAGFVRPPDQVIHKVGPSGAKAVVIWVPGGEAARVTGDWRREP